MCKKIHIEIVLGSDRSEQVWRWFDKTKAVGPPVLNSTLHGFAKQKQTELVYLHIERGSEMRSHMASQNTRGDV